MDLKSISTKELLKELGTRDGVKKMTVGTSDGEDGQLIKYPGKSCTPDGKPLHD